MERIEIQYINLFDSFENGYNSDVGGGSATYKRTEDYPRGYVDKNLL